jgi:hypothetical protein
MQLLHIQSLARHEPLPLMAQNNLEPRSDNVENLELEKLAETYGNVLRSLCDRGASEDIIDAHESGNLFPVLSSERVSSENRFSFGQAFEKLQLRAQQIVDSEPALRRAQHAVVLSLAGKDKLRRNAREETRDFTLSEQERTSFSLIVSDASTQFRGCSVGIFDSHGPPTTPPKTRTRSAAVLWDGFAGESWPSRFARLKKISGPHCFLLVGMTHQEVEQDEFPGISSRIKAARIATGNERVETGIHRAIEIVLLP